MAGPPPGTVRPKVCVMYSSGGESFASAFTALYIGGSLAVGSFSDVRFIPLGREGASEAAELRREFDLAAGAGGLRVRLHNGRGEREVPPDLSRIVLSKQRAAIGECDMVVLCTDYADLSRALEKVKAGFQGAEGNAKRAKYDRAVVSLPPGVSVGKAALEEGLKGANVGVVNGAACMEVTLDRATGCLACFVPGSLVVRAGTSEERNSRAARGPADPPPPPPPPLTRPPRRRRPFPRRRSSG